MRLRLLRIFVFFASMFLIANSAGRKILAQVRSPALDAEHRFTAIESTVGTLAEEIKAMRGDFRDAEKQHLWELLGVLGVGGAAGVGSISKRKRTGE